MKNQFSSAILAFVLILSATACKKSTDNDSAPATSKDLRVRRFSYQYNGTTNYNTYTYDSQKRLDSIYYTFSNGNMAATGYQYSATGFTRDGLMPYLTDNDGRITLQSIPYNHEQFQGYYDAAGRLSHVVDISTYNGKEEASTWYTWDGSGNLLQEGLVYISFSNTGQRLVKDSFVTVYSGFAAENANTVGQAAFGFDHFGATPVAGFWASPDGIRSGKTLPTAEQRTHYIYATPRVSYTAYTSLVDDPPTQYTITKDSKGRIQSVSHNYQGQAVVENYEYYE